MLKKLLAIVLTLALCLSAFAGCAQKSSVGVDPNKYYIGEVSGEKIPSDIYQYMLQMQMLSTLSYKAQNTTNEFNQELEVKNLLNRLVSEGVTQNDDLMNQLCQIVQYNATLIEMSRKYNVTVEETEITKQLDNFYNIYGSKENFNEFLSIIGTTVDTIKKDIVYNTLHDNLFKYFYGKNGVKSSLTDDQVKEEYKKEVALVNKLLISIKDESGQTLQKVDKDKKKALAQDILKQLQSGADFDELSKKHNEYPYASQYPDGELLVKNQINPNDSQSLEIANEALKINIGSYSLIETTDGYYIIKKLDPTKSPKFNIDQARMIIFSDQFQKVIEEEMKNVKVVFNDEALKVLSPNKIKYASVKEYIDFIQKVQKEMMDKLMSEASKEKTDEISKEDTSEK